MTAMNFNKAEFFASYGRHDQIPASSRAEIAFSGRSNVGKSSLINKIFNRRNLARVSAVPGKTATINFYTADDIFLVDLPGYGYAKVAKNEKRRWSELIGGYLADTDRDLRLVCQLVDMRHAPSAEDIQMINYMIDSEIPFVILFTKADKLKKSQREARLEAFAKEIPCFEDIISVVTSAENGEGIETVRSIIEDVSREDEQVSDDE